MDFDSSGLGCWVRNVLANLPTWGWIFLLSVLSQDVLARSTFAARFAKEAIAGPGKVRQLALYLHYFPGDGEAIVRTEIACETTGVQLTQASSVLGETKLSPSGWVEVDYRESPLGGEQVDTLLIDLGADGTHLQTRWRGEIYSSLEAEGQAAHAVYFRLGVEPPFDLRLRAKPELLFPGEDAVLELVVHNADAAGRSIFTAEWDMPEGLTTDAGSATTRWADGLAAGQSDTLQWQVRVDRRKPGSATLEGVVHGDRLYGSPMPKVRLEIASVPHARVHLEASGLAVGERGDLVYEIFNPGKGPLILDDLKLEIPSVFTEVEIAQNIYNAKVITTEDSRKQEVVAEDIGELAPGQALRLELSVKPVRSGPFIWESYFKPVGHFWFVPVQAEAALVRVVRPLQGDRADRVAHSTDLQLMSGAFKAAVGDKVRELPLPPKSRIYLQAAAKHDGNWVVEDVLHQVLPPRGYEITLRKPDEEGAAAVMRYRLVDARVVYSSIKKRWGLFDSGWRREIFGDVLLHLQDAAGSVIWAERIGIYGTDQIPTQTAELLGKSEVVERTEVAADNKVLELGLTGSIIGGLFYIFFVP